MFAKEIIRSFGRPAEYTPPGDSSSVPIRAVITDADEEMRFSSSKFIGSDAVGSVLSSVDPRKGGKITAANDATYEIYGIIPADVPGLLELSLMRISEERADPLFDLTCDILPTLGEDLTIDGKTVRCVVNRSGLFASVDEWGNDIEIVRTVISFRPADAPDVDEGSLVVIDGEGRPIDQLMNDGSGFIQGVL